MKQITSYAFNMDTACVELKFSGGTMIAIDSKMSSPRIWFSGLSLIG